MGPAGSLVATEPTGRVVQSPFWGHEETRFKATAGDSRFYTYVFQQRLGVLIDWYRVLHSTGRDERFKTWGIINDPDCCTPGVPGCPKKSLEQTYGFDFCPGDDDLLPFVGRPIAEESPRFRHGRDSAGQVEIDAT